MHLPIEKLEQTTDKDEEAMQIEMKQTKKR